MDAIEILVAKDEIRTLKARYFRFIDTKNWPEFRNLFTADALLDFPESADRPCLIGDFMGEVADFLSGAVSVHHGYMAEITIESDRTASAIWPMDDQIFFPDREGTPAGASLLKGFGHYHETYVKQDGRWLIHTLRLTRLRLERTSRPVVIE